MFPGKYVGHTVLSPEDQAEVIKNNWGVIHDLAGHFHVAAKKRIPLNTTLLFSPQSMSDVDILWKIFQRSYAWVTGIDAQVDIEVNSGIDCTV